MGSSKQRLDFYLFLCREGFVKHEDYLNSGVLMMNLNVLRAEEEKIWASFDFAREHQQLNFSKTPWFNGEAIGRLYAGVQQMNVGLKNSMIQISAAVSGKTRAFFTIPVNVDAIKNIFLIRDDEEILLAENQSSLQKLIDAMNASRGKKIFFIMAQGFPLSLLSKAGFVFGKDFFNGYDFLSAAQGMPLNSYPLLHAM